MKNDRSRKYVRTACLGQAGVDKVPKARTEVRALQVESRIIMHPQKMVLNRFLPTCSFDV